MPHINSPYQPVYLLCATTPIRQTPEGWQSSGLGSAPEAWKGQWAGCRSGFPLARAPGGSANFPAPTSLRLRSGAGGGCFLTSGRDRGWKRAVGVREGSDSGGGESGRRIVRPALLVLVVRSFHLVIGDGSSRRWVKRLSNWKDGRWQFPCISWTYRMIGSASWTMGSLWAFSCSLVAALLHWPCFPAGLSCHAENSAVASKLRLAAYLRRMNWENAVGFVCTVGIHRASSK